MGNTQIYSRAESAPGGISVAQSTGQPSAQPARQSVAAGGTLAQTPTRPSPLGKKPSPRFGAVIGMAIVAMFLLPLILVAGAALNVNRVAAIHATNPTDAIVVLGAAQYDGTPSPVFQNRLNHAKDLYNQGVASRIITVGGKQPTDRFTEAQAGREWLINNGVDPMRVLSVRSGSDTLSSLKAVGEVANERGWKSITIVSDPTHLARSQAMARRIGFETYTNATPAGDGSKVTEDYLLRETLGYLAFELFEQWRVPRIVGSA